MRRLAAAMLLGAFAATPALAKDPFDGTWKTDLSSLTMPKKPEVFAVRHGMYTCDSCEPRIAVPADGLAHPVSGHRYYDHIIVEVVDAHRIRIERYFQGGNTFSEQLTVAPDGKTLSFTFRDTRSSNGSVIGSGSEHRIGPAPHPVAAHAISGTWKLDSLKHASDVGLIFSFKSQGETMERSAATGQRYKVTIGGPPVQIVGDLAATFAALKRLSPTTLQEIDTRAGKIVSVTTMTVAPNGRTMTVVTNETVHGGMQSYKAVRQ
jgi:hypothetical protein